MKTLFDNIDESPEPELTKNKQKVTFEGINFAELQKEFAELELKAKLWEENPEKPGKKFKDLL